MSTSPERRGQARVLLVEDDAPVGRALCRVLAGSGIEVHWVQRPEEAIQLLAQPGWIAAVVDLHLGDSRVDGIDLLRAARETNPRIATVLLSGSGSRHLEQLARAS